MGILVFIEELDESFNMAGITLLDFEDSFTFNIANELWTHFALKVEVIHYQEGLKRKYDQGDTVILGPGPGHPDDYRSIFNQVESLLNNQKIKVIGICLGHQIIWRLLGAEVEHSRDPIHGQSVLLSLDKFWKDEFKINKNQIRVQRYNSLVVDRKTMDQAKVAEYNCLFLNDELMASKGPRLMTFQFHPESIGTDDSQNILGCLLS